jgi:hypothetical protein
LSLPHFGVMRMRLQVILAARSAMKGCGDGAETTTRK